MLLIRRVAHLRAGSPNATVYTPQFMRFPSAVFSPTTAVEIGSSSHRSQVSACAPYWPALAFQLSWAIAFGLSGSHSSLPSLRANACAQEVLDVSYPWIRRNASTAAVDSSFPWSPLIGCTSSQLDGSSLLLLVYVYAPGLPCATSLWSEAIPRVLAPPPRRQ